MLSRFQVSKLSSYAKYLAGSTSSTMSFSSKGDKYDRNPGDLPLMTAEERILRPLLQAHRYKGVRPEDVMDEERNYHAIDSYIKYLKSLEDDTPEKEQTPTPFYESFPWMK